MHQAGKGIWGGVGNVRESCELLIDAEIKSRLPSKGRKFLATLLPFLRNFLISWAQSLIAFPSRGFSPFQMLQPIPPFSPPFYTFAPLSYQQSYPLRPSFGTGGNFPMKIGDKASLFLPIPSSSVM